MPAPIIPPLPVLYTPGGLVAIPIIGKRDPPEGAMTVPVSILWATDAGPRKSVVIDLGTMRARVFSQIRTLYVDNLRNAAQVTILFSDTQFVIDVPAFSEGYFPVVTNALAFTAWAPTSIDATDATNIQIINILLVPGSVSSFAFQSQAVFTQALSTNISSGTTTDTILLADGAPNAFGVILGWEFRLVDGWNSQGDDTVVLQIVSDDLLSVYYSTLFGIGPEFQHNHIISSIQGVSIPFAHGLRARLINGNNISTAGDTFFYAVTGFVSWRTPA